MTGNPEIILKRGPGAGRTFPLRAETLVMGRDPRSDVVIDHPQVSRRHARITRRDDEWVIEDMDSTNGTFRNGVYLTEPEVLRSGDAIGLSDAVTLIYRETPRAPDHGHQPASGPPPAPPWQHDDQQPPRQTYSTPSASRRFDPQPPPPAARGLGPERDPYRTLLWIAIGCAVTLLALACIAVALLYALRLVGPIVP